MTTEDFFGHLIPRPRIQVAMPCARASVELPAVHSLVALLGACHMLRLHATFTDLPGSSLIHMARNRLVFDFLESDATHLLFVDDDCEYRPEDVLYLVQAGHELSGLPVAKKVPDWQKSARAGEMIGAEANFIYTPESGCEARVAERGGFMSVPHVGTGVMLIARTVFEKLAAAHPEWSIPWWDKNGNACIMHTFFWFELGPDGLPRGEDVLFCHRAKEIGIETQMLVRAKTWHIGKIAYGVDLLAELGKPDAA